MRLELICAEFADLEVTELSGWVEQGWVKPAADGTFETIDVARVHLIYDLRRSLGIEAAAVPMVLALIDQLYDLRATLKSLAIALDRQSPEVRTAVLAAMADAAR